MRTRRSDRPRLSRVAVGWQLTGSERATVRVAFPQPIGTRYTYLHTAGRNKSNLNLGQHPIGFNAFWIRIRIYDLDLLQWRLGTTFCYIFKFLSESNQASWNFRCKKWVLESTQPFFSHFRHYWYLKFILCF